MRRRECTHQFCECRNLAGHEVHHVRAPPDLHACPDRAGQIDRRAARRAEHGPRVLAQRWAAKLLLAGGAAGPVGMHD
eukprot:15462253-Alexandrium_andersonii.AAC.1